MTKQRLFKALVCYVVLALLAALSLEGVIRAAVWIFLAGLAAKTWIAYMAKLQETRRELTRGEEGAPHEGVRRELGR